MNHQYKNKQIGIFIFLFCFPFYTNGTNWFSSKMENRALKEKIQIHRQIRKQIQNEKLSSTQKKSSSAQKKSSSTQKQQYSSIRNRSKKNKKQNHRSLSYFKEKDLRNIKMILDLPLKNRKQALINYGSISFSILKYFVFSKKEQMPIRWKALTSLARVYPENSLLVVQKALQSSVWFLRNAGLIALEIINPKESVRQAGEFLNDPSLVVRTAAVGILKKHKASQYKIHLLEKLNAPDSFHKLRSLWIRHHIVSALAEFAEPGEERMFINFLQDPDERLHQHAISALEKLTGKTFRFAKNRQETSEKQQKQKWISWWAEDRYDSATATF